MKILENKFEISEEELKSLEQNSIVIRHDPVLFKTMERWKERHGKPPQFKSIRGKNSKEN
jgi:hypothetical protein